MRWWREILRRRTDLLMGGRTGSMDIEFSSGVSADMALEGDWFGLLSLRGPSLGGVKYSISSNET